MEPGPRTPQSSPSFVLPSLVLSHPRLILARLQTADMISMVQGASIVGPPVPKAVVTTKKPTSTKKAVAVPTKHIVKVSKAQAAVAAAKSKAAKAKAAKAKAAAALKKKLAAEKAAVVKAAKLKASRLVRAKAIAKARLARAKLAMAAKLAKARNYVVKLAARLCAH